MTPHLLTILHLLKYTGPNIDWTRIRIDEVMSLRALMDATLHGFMSIADDITNLLEQRYPGSNLARTWDAYRAMAFRRAEETLEQVIRRWARANNIQIPVVYGVDSDEDNDQDGTGDGGNGGEGEGDGGGAPYVVVVGPSAAAAAAPPPPALGPPNPPAPPPSPEQARPPAPITDMELSWQVGTAWAGSWDSSDAESWTPY